MTLQNAFGIPVDGTITRPDPRRRVEQRPLADLEPVIRALLADETIVAFGWTQYTPYFNDGDPCVFGVYEPWFRTADDPEYDPGLTWHLRLDRADHPSIGGRQYRWRRDDDPAENPYIGPDEERYLRALALHEALGSEAFDDALLEAFGEHAHITVRRTGITVDSYDHD